MRRDLLILTMAAVAMSVSSCDSSPETTTTSPTPAATASPASTENVEQALRKLVSERDQAIQKADTAAIDRIYADDYIATSATGLVRTKAQVMEDLKSGAIKLESISSDDIEVRVHGDTAIVTGRMTSKGTDRGREISGQRRFTQVYMKKNGRWQIVAFHYSQIAQ